MHAPHQINPTCWPIERHFEQKHLLPNHLSRETTILNVIIRTFQLKEKYVMHGASSTNTMLKGCNEVANVGRTKRLELVHHLVKFVTLKFPQVLHHSHWTNYVPRMFYLHSRQLQRFWRQGYEKPNLLPKPWFFPKPPCTYLLQQGVHAC